MRRYGNVVFAALALFSTNALATTADVEQAKSIARLYSAAFNRNPRIAGLNFWVDSYTSGRTLVDIAGGFYRSPEFTARYGTLSDRQYVEQLYNNVLGRPAKPNGLAFWENHLANGLPRAATLAKFANSPENVAKTSATFADMHLMNCRWVFGSGQSEIGNSGCLVGPIVAGVTYETPTHRGVTGARGEFRFEKGESVRFMLGSTLLGEVNDPGQVTPLDLAGSAPLEGVGINWALQDEEEPFHAAINTAVLLQSLDHDGNPDNGVEITRDVADLLQGVSLNLNQRWESFQREPRLRRLVGKANRENRFGVVHGIVKPAAALERVYDALAIDTPVIGVSFQQNQDENGNPEHTEYWQYDANGNVVRHEVDNLGVESWQYDIAGNVTRHETESTNYNVYDVETWQYDASGNVTQLREDRGRDGTAERTLSYEYDADGILTKFATETFGEINAGNSESWKYDVAGNLRQYRRDWSENGKLRSFESWQYDAGGRVTRQENYEKFGGQEDRDIETWQYDARGNPTRHGYDDGAEAWRYQYDAVGNITRKEWDANADGTADAIETWQYDANGKVTRNECSDNCGGHLGGAQANQRLETWQYDDAGRATRHECTGNCEGSQWWPGSDYFLETWQYHANGMVMLHEVQSEFQFEDYGNTYQFNQLFRYHYDAQGRLLREETDEDRDGYAETVHSYQYDANGRVALLQMVEDDDSVGVIIAGNGSPGYAGGQLYVNGSALTGQGINDIAFITYVDLPNQEIPTSAERDQGRLFDTSGTVDFTTETISQSITAGIAGRLALIRIQFNAGIPSPRPRVRFSIFAGGNPPAGEPLYSEELSLASFENNDVLSWDLTTANLFFDVGEQFTFELRTLGKVDRIRTESYRYEYSDRGYMTRRERIIPWEPLDDIESWQYDADGNLVRYERDWDGDGVFNEASSYQYEATGWGYLFSGVQTYGHSAPPPDKPVYDPLNDIL